MSLVDKLLANPAPEWAPRPQVLVSDPIPVALHGRAPRSVLGTEWWDAVRFNAYRSTNYHCIACTVKRGAHWCNRLEGHEVYEIDYLLGRMTYLETVPLCYRCHKYIHRGYLNVQREQGIITLSEYNTIVRYGDDILRISGIKRPDPYRGPQAEWKDWRLVIGNAEFPPLFASFKEYQEHYATINEEG